MDILRPPLEQQVSPVPWLLIRNNVDVPSLIGKALTARPNATVDDVVKQLSAWGAQASGIIVSMSMLKWKEQAAATRLAEGQSSAVATCIAPVMKVPARVASDRGRGDSILLCSPSNRGPTERSQRVFEHATNP